MDLISHMLFSALVMLITLVNLNAFDKDSAAKSEMVPFWKHTTYTE